MQDADASQKLVSFVLCDKSLAPLLRDTCHLLLPPSDAWITSSSTSPQQDAPIPTSSESTIPELAVALVQLFAALFGNFNAAQIGDVPSTALPGNPKLTSDGWIDKDSAVETCKFLLDIPGGLAFETLRQVNLQQLYFCRTFQSL